MLTIGVLNQQYVFNITDVRTLKNIKKNILRNLSKYLNVIQLMTNISVHAADYSGIQEKKNIGTIVL